MLLCFKQIDNIFVYDTEDELYQLIQHVDTDIRFLGEDYKDKKYTGDDLPIRVHYINRDHGWSTTKFKKLIADEVLSSSNV